MKIHVIMSLKIIDQESLVFKLIERSGTKIPRVNLKNQIIMLENNDNNLEKRDFQDTENVKMTKRHNTFLGDIEKLPLILRNLLTSFNDNDLEMMFLSLITCISAILPKLFTTYKDNVIYPNIFFYLIGKAGSGKGNAVWARKLIVEVEKQLTENLYSGSKLLNQMLNQSEEHKQTFIQTRVLIPGNITSAGFMQLLKEHNEYALMFETEGDTIVNIQKNDYGNYTDMMRKGFHHEPITSYRKTDKERIDIIEPKLSILISSTENQFTTLIPNAENGLFSRFIFAFTEPIDGFINVFENKGKKREETFMKSALLLSKLNQTLQKSNGVEFELTQNQKNQFLTLFNKNKSILIHLGNEDLDASVNRMGMSAIRICMILTILRYAETDVIPSTIYCSDDDFELTMDVVEKLLLNSKKAIDILPKQSKDTMKLSEEKQNLLRLLPQEFSISEAKAYAVNSNLSERTIQRFIYSDCFEKIGHGRYRKIE